MKFVPAIAFLSLLLFSSYKEDDDVILWSKSRRLTWDDYRGKPQKRFAAASTVYSLQRYVEKGDKHTAIAYVKAYFFCNDSWKKEDWISDEVLSHEQKHFDIVELYARRLRKQLDEMVFKDYKDADRKLDSLYHIVDQEMDVYQDKYDDETDGSMDGKEQRKWEKKIDTELETYKKYEDPAVILKLTGSD
jgi:pyruvate/2-oxoacid:ferredoxin oxidoreductase beta subunit